ncbi:CapA family protein [Streptomyces griseoviridis]|uniref:CapA family protein n=1 Tax=Streptomyces griseoviridis TaxID=45398 RepID=UPI0016753E0A|nr:CapA family protein [Streptomyces niveoruber]
MITRSRQVALALTVVLAAGAACQAHGHEPPPAGRPAPDTGAFTLVASGDVLPHGSVVERARFDAGGTGLDFRPMLAGIAPVVSRADLALCHLETGDGAAFPPEMAEGLAATGYDGCSTASAPTLDALDRAGVRHAGAARTEEEARTVTVLRAGPADVAHLACSGALDARRVLADARAAREAGADVVVVSLRWGTPWQEEPDAGQRALAGALTAARTAGRPDIDLVLGTRAHVPQPYEKVNGTWVLYGLGDQIAGETTNDRGAADPRAHQSTLGRFTFAPPARPGGRWEVTRAEFVPQLYDIDAGRVVNLNRALAQGAEVRAVRDRVRDVVLARGAAADGLAMGE